MRAQTTASLHVLGAGQDGSEGEWHNGVMRGQWMRVRHFIGRQIQHSADAEDLAQVTLALAWAKRAVLNGEPNVAPWLFVTARNEIRSYRRYQLAVHRWSLRVPTLEDPDGLAPFSTVEPDLADPTIEEMARRKAVRQILTGLGGEDAEALQLAYLRGLSSAQMAAQLHISREAARARVHRALKRAREYADRTRTRGYRTQHALTHGKTPAPPARQQQLPPGRLPAQRIRPGMTVWLAGPPFAGHLRPLSKIPTPPRTAVQAVCQAVTKYQLTRSNGAPGQYRYTLSVQIRGRGQLLRCDLPAGALVYTGNAHPAFLSRNPLRPVSEHAER